MTMNAQGKTRPEGTERRISPAVTEFIANQEIERLREINKKLSADAVTMALRLMGESDETFSPVTWEVMRRWRPACQAMLNGEDVDVARVALAKATA